MKNHRLFFLFIMVFFVCSCQNDDDVDTPICAEAILPSADFVVEQGVGFNEERRYFQSDTVAAGSIRFRALHDLDTYAWRIGDDPRVFDTKEVELNFDLDWEGSTIEVRLDGTWTPDLECFPQDQGEGTGSRTFYIIPYNEVLYIGNFRGIVNSAPQDTFIINIIKGAPGIGTYINNLPNNCERDSIYTEFNIVGTYRDFFIPDAKNFPVCPVPKGWGHIESDLQTINIEYEIWDHSLQQKMNDKFIGTKIQ